MSSPTCVDDLGECVAVWATTLMEGSDVKLNIITILGVACTILLHMKLADWNVFYQIRLFLEYVFTLTPTLNVKLTPAESEDDGVEDRTPEKNTTTSLKDPKAPGFIQCYDPSTKQRLGQVMAMTKDDVHELCVKAAAAQKEWVKTSYAERRKVLRTIQKYIVAHVEDICRVCTRDSGKPKVDALLGEIMTTCEKIRTINSNGELWLRPSYRPTGPLMTHKTAFVEYVPLGVLGVIAPWNYPFHNMLNHIISGIFAGNAVVGKVSEHTSWSSDYFGRIVKSALVAHGHNPDLVQTVTGFGDAGAALVADPLVEKVIFTGSPGVGRLVMAGASKFLKPVILELGGKDAMVFCENCKIDAIIPWAMRGVFQNCGQNCCGVERIFLYESIYDAFIDAILPKIKALRQGIPLATCGSDGDVDCGSMVMDQQMDIVQALVDDAVAKGAKLLCGGSRNEKAGGGQFYQPTVLAGVTSDMRISQEEVFGPVMTIVKVPNDDDAKCIEMVNNSNFGLGSAVYCDDEARGARLAAQIRSGMCTVNDFGGNYLIQALPFGGTKDSGFGRFAGPEGLQACCLERAVVYDRIPFVRTTIPPAIDYPMSKEKSFSFGNSLIQLFYNESVVGKFLGIIGLIKNS